MQNGYKDWLDQKFQEIDELKLVQEQRNRAVMNLIEKATEPYAKALEITTEEARIQLIAWARELGRLT